MIVKASRQQAAARRQKYVTPGGATTYVSTLVGTNKMELLAQGRTAPDGSPSGPSGPMAYLVEQDPGAVVDPHYHAVPQFQVFVGGSGRIGTHALEGVTVHYAGPHSPYGPIVAGPEGVQYVTLRPDWDPGAQWMPAAAPALRAIANRRHKAFTSAPLLRPDPACMQGVATTEVMPPDEDGAAAWLQCAGPGAAVAMQGDGPRFCYVLAGSVLDAQGELSAGGCVYVAGTEPPPPLRAGGKGAELVLVCFGGRDSRQC